MKQILTLAMLSAISVLPIFAQEKEKPKEEAGSMMPPQALNDSLFTWMIGEWTGHTESPMGKTDDYQKIEWNLDNQFVIVSYDSKFTSLNADQIKSMASRMKMPEDEMRKMMAKGYKGLGEFTINPMNGEFMGYWFDNMRGVYKGMGKQEGAKLTTTWESPRGTETRTMEKMSDDKMVESFKETDPSGTVMEGKSEWTRKK